MGSQREFSRGDSHSPCILNFDGITYRAQLINIGIGGASIRVDSDLQFSLNIGDHFELQLFHTPDMEPMNYSCEVSRLDSSELGASFYKLF